MSDLFEFDDKARVERLVGTLHDPAATTGDVLTVLADKSIAAKPGGGSGGVQVVTVPVSSAQILDLFNTPVLMVSGTPGFITQVQGYGVGFVEGTTPYTDHGGAVVLQHVGDQISISTVLALLAQGTDQFASQGYGSSLDVASADYDGKDITLEIVDIGSGAANPTDGNGSLLVTLSYFLAPTV